MELQDKNILIISPEAWSVNSPQRQLYARELAKKGNLVFFLNPPGKLNSCTLLSENIHIIDYKEKGGLFDFLGGNVEAKQLKKIKALINKKLDLVWSFDAGRFRNLSVFDASYKIFSIEKWGENTEEEREIAKSCNLALANSQAILDKLNRIDCKKLLLHHALGQSFIEALQKANYIRSNTQFATGRIRCGYVGNLQNKFIDTAVFEEIIRNNPIVEFHLIGPFVKDSNLAHSDNKTWEDPFVEFLMSAPNVRMYGSLMNVRAAEILQTMDMFLLCYQAEKYRNEVANPPKMIEYLSTGKTVVASHTDSFMPYRQLLIMADKTEELPALFRQTLDNLENWNQPNKQQERINFALAYSYEKQLSLIEKAL